MMLDNADIQGIIEACGLEREAFPDATTHEIIGSALLNFITIEG